MEEAIAAPDIPRLRLKINKLLLGILIRTAIIAAHNKTLVFVIPTKKERNARNGKENSRPKHLHVR